MKKVLLFFPCTRIDATTLNPIHQFPDFSRCQKLLLSSTSANDTRGEKVRHWHYYALLSMLVTDLQCRYLCRYFAVWSKVKNNAILRTLAKVSSSVKAKSLFNVTGLKQSLGKSELSGIIYGSDDTRLLRFRETLYKLGRHFSGKTLDALTQRRVQGKHLRSWGRKSN